MFKRDVSLLKQRQLHNKYYSLVNEYNIEVISGIQLFFIFRNQPKEDKDAYLHNVIHRWWKTKEETYPTLGKLKRVIKKTRITLNLLEKDNLLLIEERVFSQDRHIKDIGVNIKLSKKEQVGVKFTDTQLFIEENDSLDGKLIGDLLVSNRRIIFVGKNQLSFRFRDIRAFITEEYGFKFLHEDKWFVFRIHDQKTLNTTMINLITRKNKALLRRRIANERN